MCENKSQKYHHEKSDEQEKLTEDLNQQDKTRNKEEWKAMATLMQLEAKVLNETNCTVITLWHLPAVEVQHKIYHHPNPVMVVIHVQHLQIPVKFQNHM